MHKVILVPVDTDDLSTARDALALAVLMVEPEGRIHLVHVRSDLPKTWSEFLPPDFDAPQAKACEAALNNLASEANFPRERISTAVHIGGVYAQVLKEAEHVKADLIIAGSHQPSVVRDLWRSLLGVNAETIVSHATCSVMVLRTQKPSA